jgi:hypothetical protein
MQIRIVATMPLNFALFRNSIIACPSFQVDPYRLLTGGASCKC